MKEEERKQELITEAKKLGFGHDTLYKWEGSEFTYKVLSKDKLGGAELFTYNNGHRGEYFGIAGDHHAFHHCYNGIFKDGKWATVLEKTPQTNEVHKEQEEAGNNWLSGLYEKHSIRTQKKPSGGWVPEY